LFNTRGAVPELTYEEILENISKRPLGISFDELDSSVLNYQAAKALIDIDEMNEKTSRLRNTSSQHFLSLNSTNSLYQSQAQFESEFIADRVDKIKHHLNDIYYNNTAEASDKENRDSDYFHDDCMEKI
jgi:hypothetical protein